MAKYIALLRGINIGNRNKILMKDLRALVTELGYTDVKTFIQTGNVVFSTNKIEDNNYLSDIFERAIHDTFGLEIPVLIISVSELNEVVTKNPFTKNDVTDIDRLHLTFLKNKPEKEELEGITEYNNISISDKFKIDNKAVFIYCSDKYKDTKYSNNFFEKKLNVRASTRNWKTVMKLIKLAT